MVERLYLLDEKDFQDFKTANSILKKFKLSIEENKDFNSFIVLGNHLHLYNFDKFPEEAFIGKLCKKLYISRSIYDQYNEGKFIFLRGLFLGVNVEVIERCI